MRLGFVLDGTCQIGRACGHLKHQASALFIFFACSISLTIEREQRLTCSNHSTFRNAPCSPARSWLHRSKDIITELSPITEDIELEVRHSDIHGVGTFALRGMPRGHVVGRYDGRRYTPAEENDRHWNQE